MKVERSSAVIDGIHRLELRRQWDDEKPFLPVCMLNPSTADHRQNDPTILTVIHFAKVHDYGGIIVVNLCSIRTPSPKAMMLVTWDEVMAGVNARFWSDAMHYAKENGGKILAAWGADGNYLRLNHSFHSLASAIGVELVCLGTTQNGQPKHPLARGHHFIPRDTRFQPWQPRFHE